VVIVQVLTILLTMRMPPPQVASYGPQPTPDAAFAAYMEVLRNRVKDPNLGLYSAATQRLLQGRRMTDAQQRAELSAIETAFGSRIVRESALLAVICFPGRDTVPPYFLRSTDGRWTIDLAVMSRAIGFDRANRWYPRARDPEFAFGLDACQPGVRP
jgi:uncharacterized protein